jgi:predicted kinase
LAAHDTLVIFSGLPGTGKSTLANRLACELRWPLLRIDDLIDPMPAETDISFWDGKILNLLTMTEAQLELGINVIVDSVFMKNDRLHAQELARKYNAVFRPIYTFISDEALWEKRVTDRDVFIEDDWRVTQRYDGKVVTDIWERLQFQRQEFLPWQPNTALFVDAIYSVEQNYESVLKYVTNENVDIKPLSVDVPLVRGNYHS